MSIVHSLAPADGCHIHAFELLTTTNGGITCRYEMAVGSAWKLRWVETRNEIPDIINIAEMG